VHAKAPSLIRRCSNDTTVPGAAHDHGLARQFGMAKQFNRDEEGIHVGVQNGPNWLQHIWIIGAPGNAKQPATATRAGGGLEAVRSGQVDSDGLRSWVQLSDAQQPTARDALGHTIHLASQVVNVESWLSVNGVEQPLGTGSQEPESTKRPPSHP